MVKSAFPALAITLFVLLVMQLNAQSIRHSVSGSFCLLQIVEGKNQVETLLAGKAVRFLEPNFFGLAKNDNFAWRNESKGNIQVIQSLNNDRYFKTTYSDSIFEFAAYDDAGNLLKSANLIVSNYYNFSAITNNNHQGINLVLRERFGSAGNFSWNTVIYLFDQNLQLLQKHNYPDEIAAMCYQPAGFYWVVSGQNIQRWNTSFSILNQFQKPANAKAFCFEDDRVSVGYVGQSYTLMISQFDLHGNLIWNWKGPSTSFAGASGFHLQRILGRPEYLFVQAVPPLGNGTFEAWSTAWLIDDAGDEHWRKDYDLEIQSVWAKEDVLLYSSDCNVYEERIDLPIITPKTLVYPNPATEFFTIELPISIEPNTASYSVFDVNGNLCETQKISSRLTKVQFLHYPQGIFIVEIKSNDNEVLHQKIVKQ